MLLNNKKISLVHAQTALSPAIIGLVTKQFANIPLIITCHGSEIRLQKNKLLRLIQKLALHKASHVISVSNELKNILAQKYQIDPSKISVVPNGYDPQQINHLENKVNGNYIISLGRLDYPKDPITLLKAFQVVHRSFPDVSLYFVGDGKNRYILEEFCKTNNLDNNVFFLEFYLIL